MHHRGWICIAAIAGVAAVTLGQASVAVYDADRIDYDADLSLMPQIGVSETYAVVFGSHEMLLYDKATPITATNWLDRGYWTSFGYGTHQFKPFYTDPVGLFKAFLTYPRADYDPMSNTVWMVASEARTPTFSGTPRPEVQNALCEVEYVLHLSTTVENAHVTTFMDCDDIAATPPNCWHYLTGSNAIVVSDPFIQRYSLGGSHNVFDDAPQHLSLAFDERAVMVAAMNPTECVVQGEGNPDRRGQCVLILERELDGGTSSYHTNGSPTPDDMTMVRFDDLPFPDATVHALAVQEPYDHEKLEPEFENMTLFITTDGAAYGAGTPGVIRGVRLRGLFWDSSINEWRMRQALKEFPAMSGDYVPKDAPFDPALELGAVFGASPPFLPEAPAGFEPLNDNEMFTSAVLAEDWAGNNRVFAAHAGVVTFGSGQSFDNRWVVQWYVIDPDLANFHNPAALDTWTPTVVAAGRIIDDGASPEPNAGDCYLPTIGVSRCGQVYVEYTFSNATTQPQIRRATLNFAYDDVLATALVQSGPSNGYQSFPDRWALYPDMQADPLSNRFWSAHTLTGSTSNDRDAWLFKQSYLCFQTDMNRDGAVDAADMMMFTDYYTAGDMRADTDADEIVDAIDMLNFVDAYDAATGR
jgi:hypothetical protein